MGKKASLGGGTREAWNGPCDQDSGSRLQPVPSNPNHLRLSQTSPLPTVAPPLQSGTSDPGRAHKASQPGSIQGQQVRRKEEQAQRVRDSRSERREREAVMERAYALIEPSAAPPEALWEPRGIFSVILHS